MQGYLDALHKAKIYKNLQKTIYASIGIMMMTMIIKKIIRRNGIEVLISHKCPIHPIHYDNIIIFRHGESENDESSSKKKKEEEKEEIQVNKVKIKGNMM